MKNCLPSFCLFVFTLIALPASSLFAYSEAGHRVVGAVADQLIKDQPAGVAVKKLLGTVTLERAATIPDELRGEDRSHGSFHLPQNPQLEAELLAFRAANPPSNDDDPAHMPPSHHLFHYTDVPIQENSYAATQKGTSQWDIVHMINYCVRVLDGAEKPDNDRKITPGVALVLMTHLVGDIHQPLHVGAIYMDQQGQELDPNHDPLALPDKGGNDVNFGATNLHGYWDYDSVESALSWQRHIQSKMIGEFLPHDWAVQLANREPADWKPDPALKPDQWAEKWADEILPIAREAHDRLKFLPQENFGTDRKTAMRWTAIEKPHPGKDAYAVFASKTVEVELHKGGWRLAALIEATLTPAK